MSEQANYLEMGHANRSIWLLKCPSVVSRAWQEATAASAAAATGPEAGGANPNDNPVVAKVIVSVDPFPDDQHFQFKMEMAQVDSGNAPKSYSLNMHNDFAPMCIFSQSNQGKLACEGKVGNKFDMELHRENLVDYGRLCRERTNMSMVKLRKTEFIPDDTGRGMRPLPGPDGKHKFEKAKPLLVKPTDIKRTRMDCGELEKILFKLFEREPNWSIKQLMQETEQPEKFLKEVLYNLCDYNKRGPNQGTYELKPEYIKYSGDNPTT